MGERTYFCDYKHCLHPGEKVPESKVVLDNNRFYHWDCLATKQTIEEIRDTYAEKIDPGVSYPQLIKVLNDLVFKYEQDVDYIKFAVDYYAFTKKKFKSPFALLYLRNNNWMREKWEQSKRWSSASREGTNTES